MKNLLIKTFLTFSVFLSSCSDPTQPLLIPKEVDIKTIQVSRHCNNQYKPLFAIEKRKKIEEIIALLVKNNKSWERPFGWTAFVLPYKLELFSEKKLELVIWLGNSTLMGRTLEKNDAGVRVKYLSSEEIEKFLDDIGRINRCE